MGTVDFLILFPMMMRLSLGNVCVGDVGGCGFVFVLVLLGDVGFGVMVGCFVCVCF